MDGMTGSSANMTSVLIRFLSGSVIVWIVSMLLGGWSAPQAAEAQQVVMSGPGGGAFAGGLGGPGGRARGMWWEPPLTSKDLARYARTLELSADQIEAAEMLLEAMQQEFGAVAQESRQKMDALRTRLRETRDHTIAMESIPAVLRSLREQRESVEASFMDDLRLLLDGAQSERWPTLERMRLRESSLGNGMLSGESVDLIRLASELNATQEQLSGAQAILAQYELEIDRVLRAREEVLGRVQARVGGNIPNIEALAQDEEFQKLRDEAHAARMQVRETNRRYARQLSAALPADVAAVFDSEFRNASFPQVYRDSLADRALDAAAAFEDLTPEQRASLEELRRQLEQEMVVARERLASAIEKAEEEGGALAFGMGGMRMNISNGPDGPVDPTSEARAARDQVEQKYLQNLRNVLTDAQRDRLPKPRERGRRGRMTLPDGREVSMDGGEEGGEVSAMFVTEDGGERNVVILRTPGDGAPPPDGEPIRIIREVQEDEDGNVQEFEYVEQGAPGSDGGGGAGGGDSGSEKPKN